MHKKIICCCIFLIYNSLSAQASITFSIPRGRLGNVLIALAKAQYLAFKYNLRLKIPHFPYSDCFLFDQSATAYSEEDKKNFDAIYHITQTQQIFDAQDEKTLYVSHFNFPLDLLSLVKKNPTFKKKLQSLLSLKECPDTFNVPKNKTIIGIHIRTGGTRDTPEAILRLKHKFPPLKSYLKELKKLIRKLKKKNIQNNLHVRIFTDDDNPQKLAYKFERLAQKKSFTLSWRKEGNKHDINVLEDLFAMAACDYLIRPHSTYSIIAELIGAHKEVLIAHFYQ